MPSPVALLASLRLHITFLTTLQQAYRAIHSVLVVGTLTFSGPAQRSNPDYPAVFDWHLVASLQPRICRPFQVSSISSHVDDKLFATVLRHSGKKLGSRWAYLLHCLRQNQFPMEILLYFA